MLKYTNIFGDGIGFNRKRVFLHSAGSFGNDAIIFWVDMSSAVHIDNKKAYILILEKGPTQGLGEHSFTAEKSIQLILVQLKGDLVWACIIME